MGIMAYNEEANIGRLLKAVTEQEFTCGQLSSVFVVASGCTDKTEKIVRSFMKKTNASSFLFNRIVRVRLQPLTFFSPTPPEIYSFWKVATPFRKKTRWTN